MNVSWSLVITQTLLDTHVSMAMDEKKLQALMALKTTKVGYCSFHTFHNYKHFSVPERPLPNNACSLTDKHRDE
jgi:hypothetical protein